MVSIKHFKLAHLRFTFQPKDVVIMPEIGNGNIIRGAFGSTLKRLSCISQQNNDCIDCEQKTTCPFHLIFNPTGLIALIAHKRFRNMPRGFIIKLYIPPASNTKSDAVRTLVF